MSLRILLTGRDGQAGRALAAPLARFGTVRRAGRDTLDLAETKAIATRLDALAPDLIVNAAAYTNVDAAEGARDAAFAINAEAPGALARWCAGRGAALVHFSTDYVYGGPGVAPHREDEAPDPPNVYGASKAAGDEGVRASGAAHLILRTSWVYDAQARNFVTAIVGRARAQATLAAVCDQVGAPTPSWLLADILCRILDGGADARAAVAARPGLVHAAASGWTSRHNFALAIVEGLRARGLAVAARRIEPVRTAETADRARRPLNSRLDLSRLADRHGIRPPDWRAALDPVLDAIARGEGGGAP